MKRKKVQCLTVLLILPAECISPAMRDLYGKLQAPPPQVLTCLFQSFEKLVLEMQMFISLHDHRSFCSPEPRR